MRNSLIKILVISLILCLVIPTLPTGAQEKKNLVTDSTTLIGSENGTFEDGVFKHTNPSGEHMTFLNIPNLINQYSWSGDVKILEYGTDSPANGVRFCIGHDKDKNAYLNLILTRSVGISAEKRGAVYESDVYPLSKESFDRALEPGDEFHFEIRKQGNYVMMLVDGEVVMDTAFPSRYDFFTPGNEANIGFYSANCSFEVRNIEVYNEPDLLFSNQYTLTFNDLALGELARGRYDNWFIEWPSSNISSVGESGDLKYLEVKGYFQTVFAYPVAEKYTVDMKMLATNLSSNAGLFIRSSHDRFLANSKSAPNAEYFEADGAGSIGGTGLFLKPLHHKNVMQIVIKQYDESAAKKIAAPAVTIDISSIMGENDQTTAITNIRFADEGSVIKAYVNDTLIATIELSSETITYPDFDQIANFGKSTETYVKTATVKDANGEVLLTVNNTLICAEYSIMGFATRNQSQDHPLFIDDLNVEIDMVKLDVPQEPETEEPIPETGDVFALFPMITLLGLAAVPAKIRKKK